MMVFDASAAVALSLEHDFKLKIGRRDGHLYRNSCVQDLFFPTAFTSCALNMKSRLWYRAEVSFYPAYWIDSCKFQLQLVSLGGDLLIGRKN